jgi:hypothetical protein
MDISLFKKQSSDSLVLVILIGTFVCLLFSGVLVGGAYFILSMETTRLDEAANGDAKMPLLNRDGLSYFISRQEQKEKLNVISTPEILPSPSFKAR